MSRMRRCHLVLALVGIVVLPTTAVAEPARSPSCRDFAVEAAQIAGLPLPWIDAVMRAESGGNARAISAAGALGCMQILPSTWHELRGRGVAGPDPFDPRANMSAGAVYLRTMHDRYGWPDALAAYHAGIGRFEEYLTSGRPLPAATLAYVTRISAWLGHAGPATLVPSGVGQLKSWTEAPIFIASGTPLQNADGNQVGPSTSVSLVGEVAKLPVEQVEQSARDTIFVLHHR